MNHHVRVGRKITKFRLAAAKKLRATQTPSEMALAKIMNDAHIRFDSQKLIKRYIVDFWLPDYNTVIEVDGVHHEGSLKDMLRDSWFWRYGYKVVRIKNAEVYNPALDILVLLTKEPK